MATFTKREDEVVSLVDRGLSDHGIAERLRISYRTVRTHLDRMYRRFHVQSRGELVALWRRTSTR
ncbi:MAG: helix-turn-helix transcriptional regulator [Chloroflexi bacterium]|nr:helix-turn-helix transcriptional regulator [Chloroflexota bacterium]